ncbi:hypothetical protein [Psychroserpens algicola]|uniref:Uncharacterized protein n=1 Tax=Psychroserpens algicola TaxID=1719034 RepID=A0ABT0H7F3_9FLAO|nr:hypothetical protein [Psychroserpens algicola]MCK8480117.1 hypothetical protein [Psychroserpens algicola]
MKFYKNFLAFWCVIYLLIAFVGRFTSSKKEYFPFFRWSLYSKTPNSLNHAYILVDKVGDSILSEPTDIRNLKDYHHVELVDMNLIVQKFYEDVKRKADYDNHMIFNAIPKTSVFKLYETTADLSKVDYEATVKTNRVLTFKNNRFYFE